MLAGGDFIKTSTGKIQPAATLPVTLVMLERSATSRRPPASRSGSSRPAASAPQGRHQVPVWSTRGRPDWLTRLVPFGASTLLNDLLMQRTKMTTGRYSGPTTSRLD
jgi:deoxyribose-phosphate aldolase